MSALSKSIAAVRSLFGFGSNVDIDELNLPKTPGEQLAALTHAPPGWAYVKALDRKGRLVYERWEFSTPPARFESDGLDCLTGYIVRLTLSKHWFSTVTATTLDEEAVLCVWKMEGRMEVHLSFSPGEKDREKTARALFKEWGYSVKDDYTTEDKTRILSWTMPDDFEAIVSVLDELAERVYGIRPDAGLDISYQDHRDERNEHEGACSFIFTHPIEDSAAQAPE